jgi:hypothetical protein
VRELSFLLILSLLCLGPAIAQSPNATINGIVLDPSGAAIAGAQVVVVHDATGVQYTTKTNGEGIYVMPNLPPGPYRIQVSNSGFKTIVKPDIVIHVQDALAINFTLPIGASSEIVTVQGGAPLVNTESAAVSTVIDREFVESLPLNGRSFNTLLQLTPGVVIAAASANNPGQFAIAGQRTDANNFILDGVSANFGVSISPGGPPGNSGTGSAQALSALGGTSSLVSADALQEFRIETSSFAPEFGRAPGGQVILTTRSGTDDFHGEAFNYFRNTVMDANDWFLNTTGQPRAPEHHNDFGGYLGGPIWKDKTFFFFSYEGARLRLPTGGRIQVPSEYARANAPAQLAPYLNAYPHPDDRTQIPGVYTAPFTGAFSDQGTLDATSIRIDHTFDSRFSIFGRFNNAPSELVQTNFVELDNIPTNTRTLTAGLNMLLSSRLSNTLRGNYSEQTSNYAAKLGSLGGAVPIDPNLLVGPLSPSNTSVFFLPFDAAFYDLGPQARNRAKQVNFVDDLSLTIGKHRFKFGGDYRAIFFRSLPPQNNFLYEISSIQAFISGPSAGKPAFFGAGTNLQAQLLTQAFSLYGQDSFQLAPRLMLAYGVRWELNPPPSARGGTTLASWMSVDDPSRIGLSPLGTPPWSTTYRNFAPRFGVAYGLTPNSDLVLRAGAGVFYDLGVGAAANLGKYFPNSSFTSTPGLSMPISNISSYLPVISLQPPFRFAVGFAPNLKLPRSYQWNLAVEKSFAGRQAISVTYLGQAGRQLLRQEALPKPNANFASDLWLTKNSARSNYNALQLQYRASLSSRLHALLNYSWSHSLDSVSNDVVAGLSSTFISAANDYASSDFDVRHSFAGAMTYEIPSAVKTGFLLRVTRDWFIDTVVVARSGFPFSSVLFFESPDPFASGGGATTRADRVPGKPIWLHGSQCIAANGPPCAGGMGLNPVAFSIPSTIRQGTEGRNDIRGFRLTQVDLSIGRKFALTERLKLQFRTDAFNLLNHPNFTNPPAEVEFGGAFLQSTSMLNRALGGGLNALFQEGGPRSLQLSLKLSF